MGCGFEHRLLMQAQRHTIARAFLALFWNYQVARKNLPEAALVENLKSDASQFSDFIQFTHL
jgi:hypothetical protein